MVSDVIIADARLNGAHQKAGYQVGFIINIIS